MQPAAPAQHFLEQDSSEEDKLSFLICNVSFPQGLQFLILCCDDLSALESQTSYPRSTAFVEITLAVQQFLCCVAAKFFNHREQVYRRLYSRLTAFMEIAPSMQRPTKSANMGHVQHMSGPPWHRVAAKCVEETAKRNVATCISARCYNSVSHRRRPDASPIQIKKKEVTFAGVVRSLWLRHVRFRPPS